MDVVRKLILDRLEEKGMTMSEGSLKIGRNPAFLQQFLKRGIPVELKERDRIKLAALLGVPENELRGPSAALPAREYSRNNTARERTVDLSVTQSLWSDTGQNPHLPRNIPGDRLVGENDLPVFGTAQGGQGALIVTDRAVDWVVRPAPLLRVREGYGIIVTGDSMSPRINSGDTALVNPHLPVRAGDTCIFRSAAEDGTVHIIIKELRSQTDTQWRVRQLTPAKDYTLNKSEWQTAHKLVGSYFA